MPASLSQAIKDTDSRAAAGLYCCTLCGKVFNGENSHKIHILSAAHRTKTYYLLLKRGEGLQADTPGVSVSQLPVPLPAVAPEGSANHQITIKNSGGAGARTLYRCGAVRHDMARQQAAQTRSGGAPALVSCMPPVPHVRVRRAKQQGCSPGACRNMP
jgi:hypothetical protein